MPNCKTHTLAGMFAAGGTALALHEFPLPGDRLAFLAGAVAGGALGGRLPDILEPATSPHHRQFCHGIIPCTTVALLLAGKVVEAVGQLIQWADAAPTGDELGNGGFPWERYMRFFIAGFVEGLPVGYASHLVLDGHTPFGLPWIGQLN